MNPRDLGSYLGWFMWTRYCKQQNLDKFVQFLKCVAEIRPPTYIQKLPKATKSLIKYKTHVMMTLLIFKHVFVLILCTFSL